MSDNIYHQALLDVDAFSEEVPDVIQRIAEANAFGTVPLRMKYTIATAEMVLYASQFRRPIHLWNGSIVPINSLSFVIAGSGKNKDSSAYAARACFLEGYALIEKRRLELAKASAIKLATDAGVEDPHLWANHKDFYLTPNPLFAAPSTNEGFIQHMNDLDQSGIGAAYMYSGEFGGELSTSKTFLENLQLLAETFDLGNKEVKLLKSRENQSRAVKAFPVSALFQGSPENILYDESIKRIFKNEFSTKLARRSYFCFAPETVPEPEFATVKEYSDFRRLANDNAVAVRTQVSQAVTELTRYQLTKVGVPLTIDPEVQDLFSAYERYNSIVSEKGSNLYPITQLVRKHMQWKALKFAGAIAIFYQRDNIILDDFVQAIRFSEMLNKDMTLFEIELVKEPYELFSDYMQSIAVDNKSTCSLHDLRKLGYIPTSGNPTQRMKDLTHLAASYDTAGIYTYNDLGVTYEAVETTDELSLSVCPVDMSSVKAALVSGDSSQIRKAKAAIATAASGKLQPTTSVFADLSTMLEGEYVYSPFTFKDNKHGTDNIVPVTKWLVFDIDHTTMPMADAHFILSDINHHISTTSDPSNVLKYRILIELDAPVELSALAWKHFYTNIATVLGLDVDVLPQSQLFFSYGSATVLSTIDAEPIHVRDYVMSANEKAQSIENTKPATKSQIETLLADPYTTFNYAYECQPGARSRTLIRAARHAKDLKMPIPAILDLLQDINDFWVVPLEEDRFESTILEQVRKWA